MPSVLEAVISAAESALGVQYLWGGNSLASGVDCSGLVQQAFRAAGIELPRVSNAQANAGQVIDIRDIQPGDLLSWDNSSRNRGADHIAIYVGNGMMIEAPSRGKPVRLVPVPAMQSGREAGQPGNRVRTMVTRVIKDPNAQAPASNVALGPNTGRLVTAAALGVPAGLSGDFDPSSVPAYAPTSVVVNGEQGGGMGDGLPPNATPQQVEEYIRENFPTAAPFLATAEIRDILTRAAREDWSPTKVDQAMRGTEYFRTHDAPSRAVDAFLGTAGSAEVKRVTDAAKKQVADLFARNGLTLDDKDLSGLTMQAMRAGYINTAGQVADPAGLTGLLSYRLAANGGLPQGEAAATADSLIAVAKQYLVPITRKDAEEWALRMMSGSASEESYRSWLTGLAKARFASQPDVLATLDAGMTTGQYFASHTATVANLLELAPDQIDLMDPKWSWMIEVADPKGGKRVPTLGEVAQLARNRPEFANTRTYKQQAAEAQVGLSRFLGHVA